MTMINRLWSRILIIKFPFFKIIFLCHYKNIVDYNLLDEKDLGDSKLQTGSQ